MNCCIAGLPYSLGGLDDLLGMGDAELGEQIALGLGEVCGLSLLEPFARHPARLPGLAGASRSAERACPGCAVEFRGLYPEGEQQQYAYPQLNGDSMVV